jgi:hypothetical protein
VRLIPVLRLISGIPAPKIHRRTEINRNVFRIAERLDRLRLSQRLMRPMEHTGTVGFEDPQDTAQPRRLGPTVLRTSTAGPIAAAILLSRSRRW